MGERQRHRYWLWLGLTSFGGPGAQIAALQAEVVERRGWLTSEQFGRALGLCFFLPGPEAQQMVTWVAWKLDGWRAAWLASLSFILPGLIGCGLFGWAYVSYGMLPAVEGALAGVRAVVAGIIFISAWRLASSSFKGWGQGVASLVAFLGLSFGVPFGAVAIGSGLVGWWAVKPEENEATAAPVPRRSARMLPENSTTRSCAPKWRRSTLTSLPTGPWANASWTCGRPAARIRRRRT